MFGHVKDTIGYNVVCYIWHLFALVCIYLCTHMHACVLCEGSFHCSIKRSSTGTRRPPQTWLRRALECRKNSVGDALALSSCITFSLAAQQIFSTSLAANSLRQRRTWRQSWEAEAGVRRRTQHCGPPIEKLSRACSWAEIKQAENYLFWI
jgi:hypothetical protein